MAKFLGNYKGEYSEIVYEDNYEDNIYKIYRAETKKNNEECYLKVISKKNLKIHNYDFLLERLKQEEEIQTLCNSTNTVNFHRKIETEENIIFELECCDKNLNNYLKENGELEKEIKLFKEIVISIAKALKTLHEKGIMHRDIKPHNIFIKNLDDEDNRIIKLGNFNCAIKINENPSDSIGTFLYKAPEMIKDLEYDEKIDLWSLGVTLFELYFGISPYGQTDDIYSVMKKIYDEKNFVFPKTFKKNEQPKIPTLDILFKRLLTINPKNRMTYNEFFDYVFSDDFMKEGVICVNNNQNYKEIFDEILKEEFINYYKEIAEDQWDEYDFNPEYCNFCWPIYCMIPEKYCADIVLAIIKERIFPDILHFYNNNGINRFNNIIYYDINVNYLSPIDQDYNCFERITPGAFILCTNINSFKLIREEILSEISKDKRIKFNLITTGSQCDNVMSFLNEDINFKNCIKNVCIYCMNIQKWGQLKNKYNIIYDVVKTKKGVCDFIKNCSSEDIKPYQLTKIITYNDYLNKYKDIHIKISEYYGDLACEKFKDNIEKKKLLINQENKEVILYDKENLLLVNFLTFDLLKDLQILKDLLLGKFKHKTYYGELNKYIMNSKLNLYEIFSYLTARFMHILNKYSKKEEAYYSLDKTELSMGLKLPYSSLLEYERAKGKIILLSNFILTTEDVKNAELLSGRNNSKSSYNLKKIFSVILIIRNYYEKGWVSNCINCQHLSENKEKLMCYLPFSFYFVKDVKIDYKDYKADIYLDTIGKLEILEEQIQKGKELEYNKKENIILVKN